MKIQDRDGQKHAYLGVLSMINQRLPCLCAMSQSSEARGDQYSRWSEGWSIFPSNVGVASNLYLHKYLEDVLSERMGRVAFRLSCFRYVAVPGAL